MKINKKAFTLAEVLVTLAIIGVVAALTIPSLTKSTQDAQYKAAFKKQYSILSQATRLMVADNNGTLKGICSDWGHDCIKNAFLPYLSNIQSCDFGSSLGTCWHNDDNWKYLNGNTLTGQPELPGIILKNGVFLRFGMQTSNCSSAGCSECAYIWIDVNGFKGPNTIGRDIYWIHILENEIKPYGIQGDGAAGTCSSAGQGLSCGVLVLNNIDY